MGLVAGETVGVELPAADAALEGVLVSASPAVKFDALVLLGEEKWICAVAALVLHGPETLEALVTTEHAKSGCLVDVVGRVDALEAVSRKRAVGTPIPTRFT